MARPNRDAIHLRRLRDLYTRVGCIPSYSCIAAHLGFKAKNGAYKLLERLIASEHVIKGPGGRLVPTAAFFVLELSDDEVRAGFGADGEATGRTQAQALNALLISRPTKTVFVPVRGDSMVDVGILNGDIAVVETDQQATGGEIVVAEIDGSVTVKEFQMAQGRPSLVPRNASMQAQSPLKSFNILGVVRGIVRTYRPLPTGRAKLIQWGVST